MALLRKESWLSNRTLVLRYEDYLTEPEKTRNKLLHFANLKQYRKGVVPELPVIADASESRAFETLRGKDFDGYSWVKNLNQNQIKRIENHCADTMRLFGYKRFNSTKNCPNYVCPYSD